MTKERCKMFELKMITDIILQVLVNVRQFVFHIRELIYQIFVKNSGQVIADKSLNVNHIWVDVGQFIFITIFLVLCVPITVYLTRGIHRT